MQAKGKALAKAQRPLVILGRDTGDCDRMQQGVAEGRLPGIVSIAERGQGARAGAPTGARTGASQMECECESPPDTSGGEVLAALISSGALPPE